jgi:hypothetical protein
MSRWRDRRSSTRELIAVVARRCSLGNSTKARTAYREHAIDFRSIPTCKVICYRSADLEAGWDGEGSNPQAGHVPVNTIRAAASLAEPLFI